MLSLLDRIEESQSSTLCEFLAEQLELLKESGTHLDEEVSHSLAFVLENEPYFKAHPISLSTFLNEDLGLKI